MNTLRQIFDILKPREEVKSVARLAEIAGVNQPISLKNIIDKISKTMEFPQNWVMVYSPFIDEKWTEEVQGVAWDWDGSNWIFSCNANQTKRVVGVRHKALYVFKGGSPLKDDTWTSALEYYNVPHPIAGTNESDDHWGQLSYYDGFVYVSHMWEPAEAKDGKTSVVVFKNEGGYLKFSKWIELDQVTTSDGWTGYPEFQAINPWDGKIYTCQGRGSVTKEFFIHDLNGKWDGKKTLPLNGTLPQAVQGAAFSPNGHLYVAVDARFTNWGRDYKWIFYYSAISGDFLGKIPILAEEDSQELEGICYGDVSWNDGRKAQIHAILLDNAKIALDNIYFKSFSADRPEVV